MKAAILRKKYPSFIYESFEWALKKGNLDISFSFKVEPDIVFHPRLSIKKVSKMGLKKETLDNFVFHLGLIEMLSYWKATCSPKIIIQAGRMDSWQKNWWKDLITRGMGQFFYENKIDWREPDFLEIISSGPSFMGFASEELKDRYLVPMGGGKDSIVTLEKLKELDKEINCFAVNPGQATKNVLKVAGIKNPIIVERTIDPLLLDMNKKGFLNGHTPFTALLSFLSVFCAVLFNYGNVVFSNEKSSNEGNVEYLGSFINHQYSKSSEFEKRFKQYCRKYLANNLSYTSYLRKYSELEIAKMFTKYPKYFSTFSSCNQGLKTGERWCGNCPKCLFVYLALYPHLISEEILKIFNQDLFENRKLLPIMKELLGQGNKKPFECVGTFQESRLAFGLSLKKAQKSGKLPYLLAKLS